MQLFRPGSPCRAGSFTVHFISLYIASNLIGCPCRAKRDRQAAPVWHFMPCSRALLGAGLPLQGSKKNFRRRPAKTPLPLISDCPGGVVLPLPRQHSALLPFLMPGIAQTRLMCFSALALLVQVRQRRFSPCSNGRQDHGFFSGTAKARTKTAYYNVVGIQ